MSKRTPFSLKSWLCLLCGCLGVLLPFISNAKAPKSEALKFSETAYTHQTSTGNRLIEGQAHLPKSQPLDIALRGVPLWVVGIAEGNTSQWRVALTGGETQLFRIEDRSVQELSPPGGLPVEAPLHARLHKKKIAWAPFPTPQASAFTHSVFVPKTQQWVFIETTGDLVFWNENEKNRLPINALPDARILADEADRLLLLTSPSDRYKHGVLGDSLEAIGLVLIQTHPQPKILLQIEIPEPSVIEGIAPIWADLDGDGEREIIVTQSNSSQGAWLVVYDEQGKRVAEGPKIGRGNRWRNQLVVGPFGPKGVLELVDVLTPHLGGVVEFFQWQGNQLLLQASLRGYTSHVIGSRNLDMAVAGDFDQDQQLELLLPNQQRTHLGAIRRTEQGAEASWHLPIGGRMSTNIATVVFPDRSLAVGVGHENQKLRIWLPER